MVSSPGVCRHVGWSRLPAKWFHFCISGLITRSRLFGENWQFKLARPSSDDAAKNMASDCDCAESQLMNCFKVEIILKRNDDDSVLLWRWKDENKWELPWFLLRETESFQQEIQRWCSNQLVSNVCGFTLAIVLYVETILKSNVCII